MIKALIKIHQNHFAQYNIHIEIDFQLSIDK